MNAHPGETQDKERTRISGNDLFAQALAKEGVDTVFYIMGGPVNETIKRAMKLDIRFVDVRHEQAAAMMANAYARLRARPGVCMGASGPGTINLTTGLAHALVDCAPVVAFGGASPVGNNLKGAFQEIDQVAIMRPVTKWAERVYDARRIPEYVNLAFRLARSGKPGPVYLDLPGDVLYAEVDPAEVVWPNILTDEDMARPAAPQHAIDEIVEALTKAERPIILSGSGIIWSRASEALERFVDRTGIPFWTTPQGRGVIPEDHPSCYLLARSEAFRKADLVLVLGTRLNYVFSHVAPPRFSPDARIVRIDIDPAEIGSSQRIDIGIAGDARTVIEQLTAAVEGRIEPAAYAPWRGRLEEVETQKRPRHESALANAQVPIHPLRLCKEVADFISRETILVVDGQEILNYGRQSISSYRPGHRLNSGPFGTMGVGMPFGVGAKAARPDADVVILHGDGSFGLNFMELDTSVRHKLPVLVVVSLNGGWTGDPGKTKPGRDLGYTRFDEMAAALGCHGEYVEDPDEIRPALERAYEAVRQGRTAVVNVVTDWQARSGTANFTAYTT